MPYWYSVMKLFRPFSRSRLAPTLNNVSIHVLSLACYVNCLSCQPSGQSNYRPLSRKRRGLQESFNELKSDTNLKKTQGKHPFFYKTLKQAKRVQVNCFKFCFLQWEMNQVSSQWLYPQTAFSSYTCSPKRLLDLEYETNECFDGH